MASFLVSRAVRVVVGNQLCGCIFLLAVRKRVQMHIKAAAARAKKAIEICLQLGQLNVFKLRESLLMAIKTKSVSRDLL